MRILLCHERFVFRFGVDKVLLLLAGEFLRLGHQVVLAGFRFDAADVPSGAKMLTVPAARDYLESDAHFTDWLANHWDRVESAAGGCIDVAMSAGWPAFSALALFAAKGCRTFFNDHGVVPDLGYPPETVRTLEYLRQLKRIFVGSADGIVPVSDFIRRTQCHEFEAAAVQTILNGDSHLPPATGEAPSPANRCDLVLLGRFEAGCYKRSEEVFLLGSRLRQLGWNGRIGVLAKAEEITIPVPLVGCIVPLGHPSDDDLRATIQAARATLSFSRWEGFNLPLAESQALGVPCLVFREGAHPEVVAQEAQLCADLEDMARKCLLLSGGGRLPTSGDHRVFPGRPWSRVAAEYLRLFSAAVERPGGSRAVRRTGSRSVVLYDCLNAALDENNSGVVRVSRRLGAQLQRWFPVVFVRLDEQRGGFRLLDQWEWQKLSSYGGPRPDALPAGYDPAQPPMLEEYLLQHGLQPALAFLSEIRHDAELRQFKDLRKRYSIPLAGIFHDAIPILHPEFVAHDKYRVGHAFYMEELLGFDAVLPNSAYSRDCLTDFAAQRHLAWPPLLASVLLPGGDRLPAPAAATTRAGKRFALCISTFEPRKNHRRLVAAFRRVLPRLPDGFELHLVGARYAGASDLVAEIELAAREEPRLVLRGVLTDADLEAAYAGCDFTVYPSVVEGFGLPIMESLQHGKPCLTHREGVMAELAAGGGCLTADVRDEAALGEALVTLANERARLAELTAAAQRRSVKTWEMYGAEVVSQILRVMSPIRPPARSVRVVDELFLRNCWLEQWQMSDSERMGLSAVLHNLRPQLAIEVGTFRGGSLSLISQLSDWTFSLDIDPEIPHKYGHFERVSFITGPSAQALPLLLDELAAAGEWPDFILIDGDHSRAGVRDDLDVLLRRRPLRRTTVLMHDSSNPTCRAGILDAAWSQCPHVEYADLDFIPGRITEGGAAVGEVWGGLALVILTPDSLPARSAPDASAALMVQQMHAYAAGAR